MQPPLGSSALPGFRRCSGSCSTQSSAHSGQARLSAASWMPRVRDSSRTSRRAGTHRAYRPPCRRPTRDQAGLVTRTDETLRCSRRLRRPGRVASPVGRGQGFLRRPVGPKGVLSVNRISSDLRPFSRAVCHCPSPGTRAEAKAESDTLPHFPHRHIARGGQVVGYWLTLTTRRMTSDDGLLRAIGRRPRRREPRRGREPLPASGAP